MEGSIDEQDLSESLARAESKSSSAGLESALETVMDSARDLFDCSGAGLMFIDGDQVLTFVASTDEPGRILETAQEESGEGPCVDALIHDTVVHTEDVQADERWPAIRPALAGQPVHAVLGIPVRSMAGAVGSLDIYLDRPHTWGGSEINALSAFARLAETILANSLEARRQTELAEQLQQALDNRVEIERAVGVIMGREGLDPVAAFNSLRREARNRGEKAVAIARRILAGEWPLDDGR